MGTVDLRASLASLGPDVLLRYSLLEARVFTRFIAALAAAFLIAPMSAGAQSHAFIGRWSSDGVDHLYPIAVQFDADGKGVFVSNPVPRVVRKDKITWRDLSGGKIRVIEGSSAVDVTPSVSGNELDLAFDTGLGAQIKVYHRAK
jgi:hypothetical protein